MCDLLSLESKPILLKMLSCISQRARLIAELSAQLTPKAVSPASHLLLLPLSLPFSRFK